MLGKSIDEQEVLRMYQEDKTLTVSKLAEDLNVARRRITKILIDNGVKIRHKRAEISEAEKKEIRRKYFDEGVKFGKLAIQHNLHENTIRYILMKDPRYVVKPIELLEQEEKEQIIKEYLENDITHQELADKYGRERTWITRLINQTVIDDSKYSGRRKKFSDRKKTPQRKLRVSAEVLIYENEKLGIPQRKLAEKYGVSTSCIYHAIARYKGKKQ